MEVNTILNPYQKKFIEEFKKEKNLVSLFYLTGGTALAEYYLKHRESLDLDFFTDKDFDLTEVVKFIEKVKVKLEAKQVIFETLFDRRIFYLKYKDKEIRVEFTKYPFKRLKTLENFNGLRVDDKFDIAVNKLFAIFDRNEPKDFVDLYFLLHEFKLVGLKNGMEKKFDFKVEPLTLGSELLKVKKMAAMPKIFKKLTKEELIAFFEKEAGKLGKYILT